MGFKEELERLEASDIFKDWQKKNKDSYLAHGFIMFKGDLKTSWQIGFYNKKTDKVISFFMEEDIKKSPEADVFKKKGVVKKLEPAKLKIDFEKALEIAKNRKNEKYYDAEALETLVILQNLELGQVWNITFLKGVSVLNIKIDTQSGKIVEEKKPSFIDNKAG